MSAHTHPSPLAGGESSGTGPSTPTWRRITLTTIAMLAFAELVLLAFTLGPGGISPDHVAVSQLVGPDRLDAIRELRDPQRWLGIAGILLHFGFLAWLAFAPPKVVRRAMERFGRRPVLGAIAAGIALSVALTVVNLPTSLISELRDEDLGTSVQSVGSWLSDVGLSLLISASIFGLGAALLAFIVRRAPRRWWLWVAVVVPALGAVGAILSPVLFAPRFNDFQRLPASSPLARQIIHLGNRAGVDVGSVYRVDASKRTVGINAYVDGLGPTKRVVLYDNLTQDLPRRELRSIVAHELGHVAHHDVPRGILFAFLVAPLGALVASLLARRAWDRTGVRGGTVASVPALAFAILLAAFILQVPGNQLSRRIEASADAFGLRLTNDPHAFIALERAFVRDNKSEPDPPALTQFLFGTHPTSVQRVGSALRFERERGGG